MGCSAGIGRTGTFCVVHSILQRLHNGNEGGALLVNVPETVLKLRYSRAGMVQTKVRPYLPACLCALLLYRRQSLAPGAICILLPCHPRRLRGMASEAEGPRRRRQLQRWQSACLCVEQQQQQQQPRWPPSPTPPPPPHQVALSVVGRH